MDDGSDWNAVLALAACVAAACAVIAAVVSLYVLRRARSALSRRMVDGEAVVRAHVDRYLGGFRASFSEIKKDVEAMGDTLAQIAARQETEEKHVLRPRDLGALHEKINRVAEELAAVRAQANTETRMLNEQLKVVQRLLQEQLHRLHDSPRRTS